MLTMTDITNIAIPSNPRGQPGRARTGFMVLAVSLLLPSWAWAVDTVEPFGKGASDVELYFGGDGFGRPAPERSVRLSFQLGYGLTDRLSAYLNGAASSDPFFRGGDGNLRLGLYGTVVDTRYVDLDLFLDFRLFGNRWAATGIAAGLEMNVDLGRFGLFATAWEVMSDAESSFNAELGIGAHWTLAEGHQLFALYDSIVHHVPERGQPTYEVGGVALGYNVMVHTGIELINEVKCDLPQGGEQVAFGVSTGILATLP